MRHDHAARAEHRLGDDARRCGRRPRSRPAPSSSSAQPRCTRPSAVAAAVGERRGDPADVGQRRLERQPQRRHALHADAAERGAVVAAVAGHEDRLADAAARPPVEPRQLQRRVDRLRALHGEEHAVEVARRPLREALRELGRERVPLAEQRRRRQHLELRGDRGDDVLAPVAEVDAPEARERVEDATAVDVGDPAAVAGDDHAARVVRLLARERVPEVRLVGLQQPHLLRVAGPRGHWSNSSGERARSLRVRRMCMRSSSSAAAASLRTIALSSSRCSACTCDRSPDPPR